MRARYPIKCNASCNMRDFCVGRDTVQLGYMNNISELDTRIKTIIGNWCCGIWIGDCEHLATSRSRLFKYDPEHTQLKYMLKLLEMWLIGGNPINGSCI